MLRSALTIITFLGAVGGPALAQSPPIAGMVTPEGVALADGDGDRVVTTDEFRSHVERVFASVVEENKRRWAIMIKVLDAPAADRLHVRAFHELNERFKRRIDADRDGKPSRREIEDYARKASLPVEMIGDIEWLAAESFSAQVDLSKDPETREAAMREIERELDRVPEDQAYFSSDGGTGSGSDGRWVREAVEGHMSAWRALAKDGSYRLP